MNAPPTLTIDRPIHLLGDNHGFIEACLAEIEEEGIRDAIILHVGDGDEGIAFYTEHFQVLNEEFAHRNLLYLGMRGNHCDPSLFDGSVDLPNFKLVRDYTRLSTNVESWLLIGGAISIDRLDREKGTEWWPEEKFHLRRDLLGPADVLVTHSGPRWVGPPSSNEFVDLYADAESEQTGADLIGELETERMLHEEVFRIVRPRHWYLGHFHNAEEVVHQGCFTRVLAPSELYQHDPTHL